MTTQMAFRSVAGKEQVLSYYDLLLEHMTMPYEKLDINTRYGNTFALAVGKADAPPLVLLHGSSMNAAMWINDMQAYARSFRVYALDLPGEPGRSDERQLPFDTLDYVQWLADVFHHLQMDKAALVGASLGAWLAAKFAAHHQDKVSKLVLLCPAGVGSQNQEFKEIALALLSKGEGGVKELFRTINGDDTMPEIILNYQMLIGAHFNTRQEEIPLFSDEELMSLSMPSLLFVGEKDILLRSAETAQRYGSLVKQAQIVMLPEKGHSLTGLVDEIQEFLEKKHL